MTNQNERVVLVRDLVGNPQPDDFRYEHTDKPALATGQVLVETQWLSLDPYVRALLSGRHFLRQPKPGDVLPARSVARVIDSRHAVFSTGDRIVLETGLQRFAVSNADDAWPLHAGHTPASTALGILGMPGMTAYFGLLDVAQIRAGDTVLVSAASGPVGSMVVKLRASRVRAPSASLARRASATGRCERLDSMPASITKRSPSTNACVNLRRRVSTYFSTIPVAIFSTPW